MAPPAPSMVTVDPPSRPVEFTPSKTPYDPRHMLAGMTRLVGWQIDRQIPPHFSHTLFAGRYLTSNTLYSQADTSLLTHSIRRQIPHFSHTLFAGRYLTSHTLYSQADTSLLTLTLLSSHIHIRHTTLFSLLCITHTHSHHFSLISHILASPPLTLLFFVCQCRRFLRVGLLRQRLLQGVPRRVGQVGGHRPRPSGRHQRGGDRCGDTAGGTAHPC